MRLFHLPMSSLNKWSKTIALKALFSTVAPSLCRSFSWPCAATPASLVLQSVCPTPSRAHRRQPAKPHERSSSVWFVRALQLPASPVSLLQPLAPLLQPPAPLLQPPALLLQPPALPMPLPAAAAARVPWPPPPPAQPPTGHRTWGGWGDFFRFRLAFFLSHGGDWMLEASGHWGPRWRQMGADQKASGNGPALWSLGPLGTWSTCQWPKRRNGWYTKKHCSVQKKTDHG
jgi:hypothetical protein